MTLRPILHFNVTREPRSVWVYSANIRFMRDEFPQQVIGQGNSTSFGRTCIQNKRPFRLFFAACRFLLLPPHLVCQRQSIQLSPKRSPAGQAPVHNFNEPVIMAPDEQMYEFMQHNVFEAVNRLLS